MFGSFCGFQLSIVQENKIIQFSHGLIKLSELEAIPCIKTGQGAAVSDLHPAFAARGIDDIILG